MSSVRQQRRFPSLRGRRGLVVLAGGLALLVGVIGLIWWLGVRAECARACPSDQTRSFANEVGVSGFQRAFKADDGRSVKVGLVGPALPPPSAVTGPGLRLRESAPGAGGTGRYEVLLGEGESQAPGWTGCRATLWQVKPSFAEAYSQHLSAATLDEINAGKLVLVIVNAGCDTDGP